jgi:hypothetical protein
MNYDPKWHSEVDEGARWFDDPAKADLIRKAAQRIPDDRGDLEQRSKKEYERRVRIYLAEERAGMDCAAIDPLRIDKDIVDIAALLPHVRPRVREWLAPIHTQLLEIAKRTLYVRQQILLLADQAPTLDIDPSSDLGIMC